MAPSYLSSLTCVVTPSHCSLHSLFDGTLLFFPPMISSKILGYCSFMFLALCNNLPWDIWTTTSLSCIRITLKHFCFPGFFVTRFLFFNCMCDIVPLINYYPLWVGMKVHFFFIPHYVPLINLIFQLNGVDLTSVTAEQAMLELCKPTETVQILAQFNPTSKFSILSM